MGYVRYLRMLLSQVNYRHTIKRFRKQMHAQPPAVWAAMVLSPYVSVRLQTSATAALKSNDEAITKTGSVLFNSRYETTINRHLTSERDKTSALAQTPFSE